MSVFADSSAVVKLYADEAGFQEVRNLQALVISEITHVEVVAALHRKRRTGELSPNACRMLAARFGADVAAPSSALITVRLTGAILQAAARLVAAHDLRAHDAVQLASALAVSTADPACATMAAFDIKLRDAAEAEGLALIPAALPG